MNPPDKAAQVLTKTPFKGCVSVWKSTLASADRPLKSHMGLRGVSLDEVSKVRGKRGTFGSTLRLFFPTRDGHVTQGESETFRSSTSRPWARRVWIWLCPQI